MLAGFDAVLRLRLSQVPVPAGPDPQLPRASFLHPLPVQLHGMYFLDSP